MPWIKKGEAEDLNNNSIVGKIVYEKFSCLLTGDAEKGAEHRLIRTVGPQLKANVLKVGHHGSNTSSEKHFLQAVNPDVAVMTLGAGNDYGLPHKPVLKRYNELGIQVFRTDRHGTITIETDGKDYKVNIENNVQKTVLK